MNELLERALRQRHRALDRVPLLECGDGWRDLISLCAQAADAELVDFAGVKEKFGKLQIDVAGANASPALLHLIKDCESRSATVCEVCGSTGSLALDGGWTTTRCFDHRGASYRC